MSLSSSVNLSQCLTTHLSASDSFMTILLDKSFYLLTYLKCTKMHHFNIKISKNFWGIAPSPDPTPLTPSPQTPPPRRLWRLHSAHSDWPPLNFIWNDATEFVRHTCMCHQQITLTSWYRFYRYRALLVIRYCNGSHWGVTAGKALIGLGVLGDRAHTIIMQSHSLTSTDV